MHFDQEQYDELVMNLVVEGGNARSLAMEAIQEAKKVTSAFPEKPVAVIDMRLYGMMKGKEVLASAIQRMG